MSQDLPYSVISEKPHLYRSLVLIASKCMHFTDCEVWCAGSYSLKEEELQTLGEFNVSDCIRIHVSLDYSITSKAHGACRNAWASLKIYRQTCILQARDHLDRSLVQSKLCKSDTEQEQSMHDIKDLQRGICEQKEIKKKINSISHTPRIMLQICGMDQCMYVEPR
jgi:hypothetical protein